MSSQISPVDYVVLAIILLISICIGLYHGFREKILKLFRPKNNQVEISNGFEMDKVDEHEKKQETSKTSEYLTANAQLGTLPVAFSLLASFYSATSLLGIPAEVYQYGIQYWMISFGQALCPLIGAFITAPFFANHKVASIFEYFELRFASRSVRLVATGCYLVRNSISCKRSGEKIGFLKNRF